MAQINKDQIKIIHTLKSKIGMPDDDYRAFLSGYKALSCKDLSFEDAKQFINNLSKIANKKGVYIKKRST